MDRVKKNIIELSNCSIDQYKKKSKLPVKILADNVRSMYNIGALFRTSDAFLIDEFILGGITGTPPHPEITKTALGAEESVAWSHVQDSYKKVVELKDEGWKICCLEQTHNSISLDVFKVEENDKYVIVLGNEVKGVDQRIVDISDYVLEIPQYGVKHSLNVSSSGSIAMWHFFKAYKNSLKNELLQ